MQTKTLITTVAIVVFTVLMYAIWGSVLDYVYSKSKINYYLVSIGLMFFIGYLLNQCGSSEKLKK